MLPWSVFTSLRVSTKVYGSEEAAYVAVLKYRYNPVKPIIKSKSTAPESNIFHGRRIELFEADKMSDSADGKMVSSARIESEALRISASKSQLSESVFSFARVSVGDSSSLQDTFKI